MIRRFLIDLLSLRDTAPPLPVGSRETIAIERAAPGYLRYLYLRWGLSTLAKLGGVALFLGLMAMETNERETHWFLFALEAFAVLSIVLHAAGSFLLIRLDYELRWYVISDTSLLIREGVWTQKELTLSFQNVQNIRVTQGPVERLFGVSTIQVDTAGGGVAMPQQGQQGSVRPHTGHVRGVAEPHRIRDQMLELLRRQKGQGLGDAHEHGHEHGDRAGPSNWSPAARAALSEAAAQARRLRAALADPS